MRPSLLARFERWFTRRGSFDEMEATAAEVLSRRDLFRKGTAVAAGAAAATVLPPVLPDPLERNVQLGQAVSRGVLSPRGYHPGGAVTTSYISTVTTASELVITAVPAARWYHPGDPLQSLETRIIRRR